MLVAADPVASVVVLNTIQRISLVLMKKDMWFGQTNSFANNPLRAANAPLAIASVTHRVSVSELLREGPLVDDMV